MSSQRSYAHAKSLSLIQSLEQLVPRLLSQGYCERKTTNLEKPTSSVLYVLLLIYGLAVDKTLHYLVL